MESAQLTLTFIWRPYNFIFLFNVIWAIKIIVRDLERPLCLWWSICFHLEIIWKFSNLKKLKWITDISIKYWWTNILSQCHKCLNGVLSFHPHLKAVLLISDHEDIFCAAIWPKSPFQWQLSCRWDSHPWPVEDLSWMYYLPQGGYDQLTLWLHLFLIKKALNTIVILDEFEAKIILVIGILKFTLFAHIHT